MSHINRITVTLVAIYLSILMAGCAVIDKDNRRTLNLLNEQVWSEEPAVKLSVLPVQTAALMADIAVVNPAASLPKAAAYSAPQHFESVQKAQGWRQKSMAVAGSILFPVEFVAWWTMFSLIPVEDAIAF